MFCQRVVSITLKRIGKIAKYESKEDRIIIKRSQLSDVGSLFATLFHELAHATSEAKDNTREFENELGEIINRLSKTIFEKI